MFSFCDRPKEYISDGKYALKENLARQPRNNLAYPSRKSANHLLEKFKDPPHGYGEVPFFWWTGGEELSRERLRWQLDQLTEAPVLGLNVSYNHTHKVADSTSNKGRDVLFGVAEPSNPDFMTEEWWDIWNWFSEELGKSDMGLGLDDYVVGHEGAGYWADKVKEELLAKNYQGKLLVKDPVSVKGGTHFTQEITDKTITVMAYPKHDGHYDFINAINLLELAENMKIDWMIPDDFDGDIIRIETTNGYMIHPEHGNTLIKHYYHVFENNLSPEGRKGMNFFFQDELKVDIDQYVWSEDFAGIFHDKKGYDIRPLLPALYHDIGDITPKIRLDYNDVMIELAEKRYFKPIFEWHWKRGLVFGCDNWGRGLEPGIYGDYFRATRWFSAPGNDAPRSGYSFIQTKVSSSIAHLYKRPRVWLEAYHSMGWNARPSQIHFSTHKHYQFGANLMCLHGLYYSTHGGWWEWAPPDFHFRMPYWPHFKEWLKSAERLSYLLSQGKHVCDAAIMYPVAPLQAKNGGSKTASFTTGEIFFNSGMDFDFIDFQSLNRAKVNQGQLAVSDEKYRILVLADMSAIHYSSLKKALEFHNNGGIVVGVGQLPQASDRKGSNDPEIDNILKTIFGYTAAEASKLTNHFINEDTGTGIYFPKTNENMVEIISPYLSRDFYSENGKGSVLHRKIDNQNLYMVMDIPEGSKCFFRTNGKPLLLDTESGNYRNIDILEQTNEGTFLQLPLGEDESNLILFDPGEPVISNDEVKEKIIEEIAIDGLWQSEFIPTLDNRWGDFRNPAGDDTIGIEARNFKYKISNGFNPDLIRAEAANWDEVTYSYGPKFMKLQCSDPDNKMVLRQILDGEETIYAGNEQIHWENFDYSLRWGVENSPGSQGYHGLKYKISDDFLLMPEEGSYFFKSYISCPDESPVDIIISGKEPEAIFIDGEKINSARIHLKQGSHQVVLFYSGVKEKKYTNHWEAIDLRERSSVVFKKSGYNIIPNDILSMKWFGQDGILNFDIYPDVKKIGYYRFTAPPGLSSLQFDIYGKAKVYQDGIELKTEQKNIPEEKCFKSYEVYPREVKSGFSDICIEVEHEPGYYGGAAFPDPVKLQCGEGLIQIGDWSEMGVLKSYSGGLWYRKNIKFNKGQLSGNIYLDLGDVAASAEVHINGRKAGTCVRKPFRLDISDFITGGDNYFEILVYSTLVNHYSTIPTPQIYRQSYEAGLLGPVIIIRSGIQQSR